ncbi:hypothetical protein ANCCEY_08986 [Ancylostoma ceylanicum]|uniref:SXP/RAL-2 family protein Ani s 5-like cation-binding domain-containing protein n=2 Tax=Ancylostoma ceylanicum TaxID=53326 RepID=A0A0D6LIM9_9BILA|nr:hypothetical protein ANCCEY_08986 [Ancylostoma ceylanicum]EYC08087.1 hypothetical protein Y032_0067g114 [Ancylostoma ceylanicum]
MLKLFFVVIVVPQAYTHPVDAQLKASDVAVDSLPGVSEENMEKLRQMLTPLPPSIEKLGKIAEQWTVDLPDREREALEQHIEEMRRKLNMKYTDTKID